MSIPCQVLLKPRSSLITRGPAYIPGGPEYAPIQLSHQDPPPDSELKNEWQLLDFDCSITLDRYLPQYHREILPFPSLDESLDICTLYVEMKCGALPEYVQKLVDFRLRTARESVRWMRSIPSETLEKARVPYTHSSTEGLDEQVIARMMVFFSMRSMDNALIELKSWLCLFYQVDDWLLRWNYYQLRVDRRHAESHLICPAEWILLVHDTSKLYHDTSKFIRSVALRIPGAIAIDRRPSSPADIPLEHINGT